MRRLAFALALVLLLVLLGAACSSTSTPGVGLVPSGPDPLACQVDTDCRAGPLVNPDQPCCDTGVDRAVFSVEYLAWRTRWKASHCADVECPMMPPPAPPLPCALAGRCAAGRCADTCDRSAAP